VPDAKFPRKKPSAEEREFDYLICKQCNNPCYVFEMEKGAVHEAQCLVCGNEDIQHFDLGEEAGSEYD